MTGIRSSVGTGCSATTGCPFRRARYGTVAKICCVIPRRGRTQVTHGVLHKTSLGHNPRSCCKLRNLIQKSKGSRPSPAKRLVVHRDESSRSRASAAVLVTFKRVLPLSSCTCITSCGTGSGGHEGVRHIYARHDRTAAEHCLRVPSLGIALRARKSSCAAAWPRATCGLVGAEGDERARGPCVDGRRSGGCDSASSGHMLTAT